MSRLWRDKESHTFHYNIKGNCQALLSAFRTWRCRSVSFDSEDKRSFDMQGE